MPEPVEDTILGVKVSSTPLLYDYAQPLLPQILEIIAIASQDLAALVTAGQVSAKADVADPATAMKLLPSLKNVAAHLATDGRLERLAPKILATTRVAIASPSGPVEWQDMSNAKDRAYTFDTHPEIYFPLLIFAGKVTFGRFFPVARSQKGSRAKESSSPDSSPSIK